MTTASLFSYEMANGWNGLADFDIACESFEATYGKCFLDVCFGSKESDYASNDPIIEDVKVLNAYDCWLFVEDVCPNFSDYDEFCANGGYDDPATDEAVMNTLTSGKAGPVMKYASKVSKDSITKVIGSIA